MADAALRKRSRPKSTGTTGRNGTAHVSDVGSTAKAIVQTTASEWLMILSLIFGGCCSNAYTLELATRQLPTSGTLITFAQFLITTLSCLPHFVTVQSGLPRLKQRNVPVYRWLVQVVFYLSTSLLNNMAFAYNVPMPVHIVFRSGGLVINMLLGYLVQHRRYSLVQVASVLLVTAGVMSSTLCTSSSGSNEVVQGATKDASSDDYLTGVLYLFAALVLSGFMGLWQEKTFRLYGNQNWRESLFYSHLLSLPMFALRGRSLLRDIRQGNDTIPWWFGWGSPESTSRKTLLHSDRLHALLRGDRVNGSEQIFDVSRLVPAGVRKAVPLRTGVWIPSFYPPLLLNVATQLLCINGVNRLTSKVSSLSVTLVLVVRKALSLFISVMLVSGGTGSLGLWLGASAVLLGTIGYSLSKSVKQPDHYKSE